MNRFRTLVSLLLALTIVACVAAPALAADGHGEEAVDTNPLTFKSNLAIWTAVIFLILLAVLGKFAWGPIIEGLDRREKRIAGEIAEAEQRNAEALQKLQAYEQQLAASAEEGRRMIADAKRRADAQAQEIVAQAQADAQAEVERARREIETAEDMARKQLAEQSASLAVQLAGRIVGSTLSPADHSRLIEQAVSEFAQRN